MDNSNKGRKPAQKRSSGEAGLPQSGRANQQGAEQATQRARVELSQFLSSSSSSVEMQDVPSNGAAPTHRRTPAKKRSPEAAYLANNHEGSSTRARVDSVHSGSSSTSFTGSPASSASTGTTVEAIPDFLQSPALQGSPASAALLSPLSLTSGGAFALFSPGAFASPPLAPTITTPSSASTATTVAADVGMPSPTKPGFMAYREPGSAQSTPIKGESGKITHGFSTEPNSPGDSPVVIRGRNSRLPGSYGSYSLGNSPARPNGSVMPMVLSSQSSRPQLDTPEVLRHLQSEFEGITVASPMQDGRHPPEPLSQPESPARMTGGGRLTSTARSQALFGYDAAEEMNIIGALAPFSGDARAVQQSAASDNDMLISSPRSLSLPPSQGMTFPDSQATSQGSWAGDGPRVLTERTRSSVTAITPQPAVPVRRELLRSAADAGVRRMDSTERLPENRRGNQGPGGR